MAQSMTQKQQLEKLDDVLREKYLNVVRSLDLDGLKHFNKGRNKKMIMAEIAEQIPNADKKDIDSYVQCISNHLHSEAQHIRTQKIAKPQHKKSKRKSTLKDKTNNDDIGTEMKITKSDKQSETTNQQEPNENEHTESTLEKLDNIFDTNDTLSSTITVTCLDDTYEENLDDSVTQLKTVNQLKDITKPNQDVNISNDKTSSQISADQDQDSLLAKHRNNNHSPGI